MFSAVSPSAARRRILCEDLNGFISSDHISCFIWLIRSRLQRGERWACCVFQKTR